ncbi:MAG: hypothetical protein HY436_00455 [Candidatus Liptonbacteria bacterium]|nr:hypothetical protein [Candidatus Liptonbacteria bacterium]
MDEITASPPSSMRKKLALGIVCLLLALGVAAFFLLRPSSERAISFRFDMPDSIAVGAPFMVGVEFANVGNRVLKEVRLSLSLPDGVSFVGSPESQRIVEQKIGDLGPGSVGNRDFTLIALSDPHTLKRIGASLAYLTPGSSAEFAETSEADLSLGESAVELLLTLPERIVSGERFTMTVSYQNRGREPFRNLTLRMEYPPVFQFRRASIAPSAGNSEWRLGDVLPGTPNTVEIEGTVIGPVQAFSAFRALLVADFLGATYVIAEQNASLGIQSSPLALEVRVNGSLDYVARRGERLSYMLAFRNNTDTTLQNISVGAELVGSLYDVRSVETDGALNSVTNVVSWSVANTPSLASLAPGQSGTVSLRVKLLDAFPVRRFGDKNFTLTLRGRAESPTVPAGTAAEKTTGLATLETKVLGELSVDARALFRDAASGILNSGPYPPRVNQPTRYTVHWKVAGVAADATGVQVTGFVQSGGKWTGNVTSNISELPTYEPSSGRVIWAIPQVNANRGILSVPAEVIFQIEITPAANQAGGSVAILSETRAQGTDPFTGLALSAVDGELTTLLPDDPSVAGQDNSVRP